MRGMIFINQLVTLRMVTKGRDTFVHKRGVHDDQVSFKRHISNQISLHSFTPYSAHYTSIENRVGSHVGGAELKWSQNNLS